MNKTLEYRKYATGLFSNVWLPTAAFLTLFSVMRGLGTLSPEQFKMMLPLGFTIMAVLPFVFLTKKGRQQMGLKPGNQASFYLLAIIAGISLSLLCYFLGTAFFGSTGDNWFVSIKEANLKTLNTIGMSRTTLFLIFTIPSVIFSPIGEELFFRGFLQESLATRLNYQTSMIVESLAFGFIHLFHHGLVREGSAFQFLWISGFIWVGLMTITAYVFAFLKWKSGSIYPSMLAHAMFNATMGVCMFYWL